MCFGEVGEKEKESARGTLFPAFSLFPSSPRAFYFLLLLLFYRDTLREPLRRTEWQCHINEISKKIASGISAIKRIRYFLPFEILINVTIHWYRHMGKLF